MSFVMTQTPLDGYAFPVFTTESCPRNLTEWGERSSASTVPRSTPICVFLMKTSRNFWSYVTVCLKFKFSKVFNYFENLEKMLVDPVLNFFTV